MTSESLEQRLIDDPNSDVTLKVEVVNCQEESFGVVEESDSLIEELKELMKIGLPVGIATLARLALYTTDTAFIGHLGDAQLTAATLVNVLKDITSNFCFGFAYVLNQVCSQAIGAGNPKMAGNWLQLCLTFCTVSSVPMIFVFYFGGNILAWFNNDQDVLVNARIYGHYASLIALPAVLYMALRQFFQAAQIVIPATIVSLLTIGVNILLNQVLVRGIAGFGGFGLKGSPLATFFSYIFQISVFMSIVLYKGYFLDYWGGWSWSSFRKDRVIKLLRLAIPLTLGVFLENGGWQVVTMCTSKLGEVKLSAMSILYSTWGILWAFYWGFGLALQVRVGYHLGEGNLRLLRKTLRASIVSFVFLIGGLSTGCYVLRKEIGRIFSDDPAVLEVVADTMPFLCLNYFIGCLELAGMNILEGMSRNKILLVVTVIGMWGICIPLFFYFTFHCPYFLEHGQLKGVWMANASSELFKCIANWVIIFRSDLKKLSKEARRRNEVGEVDDGELQEENSEASGDKLIRVVSPRNPTLQNAC